MKDVHVLAAGVVEECFSGLPSSIIIVGHIPDLSLNIATLL